jgi:hypothetical protein
MTDTQGKRRFDKTLLQASKQLLAGLAGKGSGLWTSYLLTRKRVPMNLNQGFTRHLTSLLESTMNNAHHKSPSHSEEQLCANINKETIKLNRNNLTRTAAYLNIYQSYPELHWAFLAHLVSRNGGWSMTDLKGQWLPHLLDENLRETIFKLLEACNSLIFGDAYPQLLLYAESKRIGRNLSYLLPQFGVSAFMIPLWDLFWLDGNPVPLTAALVVNEQSFIQSRVVEDKRYRDQVFNTFSYRSQPLMQLNQIVFPLWQENRKNDGIPMCVVGRVLENFADLDERIEFGKSLYGMLFGYPDVLQGALAFAKKIAHSGSRADYWPDRFKADHNQKTGRISEKSEHAAGENLPSLWLSPSLSDAWPDRPLAVASKGDWFKGIEVVSYLTSIRLPHVIDMTHEHLFGQNKLQAALLLERSFRKGANSRRTGRG